MNFVQFHILLLTVLKNVHFIYLTSLIYLFNFETGPHYVALDSLKLNV